MHHAPCTNLGRCISHHNMCAVRMCANTATNNVKCRKLGIIFYNTHRVLYSRKLKALRNIENAFYNTRNLTLLHSFLFVFVLGRSDRRGHLFLVGVFSTLCHTTPHIICGHIYSSKPSSFIPFALPTLPDPITSLLPTTASFSPDNPLTLTIAHSPAFKRTRALPDKHAHTTKTRNSLLPCTKARG